jgi:hypothetical protein
MSLTPARPLCVLWCGQDTLAFAPVGGIYLPRFNNVDGSSPADFARGYAVQGTIGRLPVPDGNPGVVGLMGCGEMLRLRQPHHPSSKAHRPLGKPDPKDPPRNYRQQRALMRGQVRGLREMSEATGYQINFVGSALGVDSKKEGSGPMPTRSVDSSSAG